jgi:hypothetical protein
MSGINRININIPPWSSQAATSRDEAISKLVATYTLVGDFYKWTDVNSGWGTWTYLFIGYGYLDGIPTIATVICSGMTHPPSGSPILAAADPGVGSNTWSAVGTLPQIGISSGGGGGWGSAPNQNSSGYVWNIPGNSSTAAADFTAAIAAVAAQMPNTNIFKNLFKYVDAISGAWQVSCVWFSPGIAPVSGSASNWPNSNMMYVVTCSGSPNPPSGSGIQPVTMPSFTQTFTTITGPLSFGPMR